MRINLEEIVYALSLVFVGAMLFGFLNSVYISWEQTPDTVTDLSECENKTLEDSVKCLVDYVRPYYDYKKSPDVHRTNEEILMDGGDSFDYSNLYYNLTRDLGFDSLMLRFYNEDHSEGHQVAFTYSYRDYSYCLVDQTKFECFKFKSQEFDN